MSIHDGHRERLRTSFVENGLDSFNELNSLELLLFYAIPRRDTNEIAHRLLDTFGSLSNVLSAEREELMQVEGVGESAANLISLVPQIMRKSYVSRTANMKYINSSADAGKYFLPRFLYKNEEILFIVCIDSSKRIISCIEISRGCVNAVETNVRRIVETALKFRATSVIMAHNHPNGIAMPSREDDISTQLVRDTLRTVGITLADHIIVAGESYTSYADSGFLR
ncbi:MAG: DNA repair protein RadC [Eubacteriales bacterium]|nr:DNA repair protein RadC [Eubacteriales bacterium]